VPAERQSGKHLEEDAMSPATRAPKKERPNVMPLPELCKGCGRCITVCARHSIHVGDGINQASGFIPVEIDYNTCNHCGVCVAACPEPYGIITEGSYELEHPAALYGDRPDSRHHIPEAIHPKKIALPKLEPMVLKGNYTAAVGALLAGCRHVYGYPITPSTEGTELMARLLPQLDGHFVQAISEVATINHMYGCGAAGWLTNTWPRPSVSSASKTVQSRFLPSDARSSSTTT